MNKKGIYGFGLLLLLVFYPMHMVLAAVDNLKLTANITTPLTTNKIVYNNTAGDPVTVSLSWKEKMVYAPDAEVNITVTNALIGDLIIKVDLVSASTPADSMSINSAWLKYDTTSTFSHSVEIVVNGTTATGDTVAVDKKDLNTLCLVKQLPPRTTTTTTAPLTLYHFISNLRFPGYIMFTAILVDDVTKATPQVIGVDALPIFFNDIDPNVTPIWLQLIQSD